MGSNHKSQSDQNDEIVVFSIINPSTCSECGAELTKGRFLKMEKEKPLCLECADLDHLVYLQRGDAALTRRSRKYSNLSAVVVRFNRSRHRYVRHKHTDYDQFLSKGWERIEARSAIAEKLGQIVSEWSGKIA